MDTRITILTIQDEDNVTDIRVTAERDYKPIFLEAFSSIEKPLGVHLIEKKDIVGESAANSGSRLLLSNLLELISNGVKTDGRNFLQEELDLKFQIKDFPVIKRFEEISGVSFDWSKFNNAREFKTYVQHLFRKDS